MYDCIYLFCRACWMYDGVSATRLYGPGSAASYPCLVFRTPVQYFPATSSLSISFFSSFGGPARTLALAISIGTATTLVDL